MGAGGIVVGFDETGSSGNMSVAARSIHVGHARLQLAMPVLQDQVDENRTRIVANGDLGVSQNF